MINWLVITWTLMVGWLPSQNFGMGADWHSQDYLFEQHNNATKIEFNIEASLWDRWDIYGGFENFQSLNSPSNKGISFDPYSIKYTIGTEVYLMPKSTSNFNVSVYAKHECQHPVNAWAKEDKSSIFDSASNEIGIRVKGTVSF